MFVKTTAEIQRNVLIDSEVWLMKKENRMVLLLLEYFLSAVQLKKTSRAFYRS